VDSGAGNPKFDIVEKRDQTVCGDGRLSKERWGDTETGRLGEGENEEMERRVDRETRRWGDAGKGRKKRWGDTEMGRQGEKDKGERKKDKGKRRIKNGNYKLKSEKCKVKE